MLNPDKSSASQRHDRKYIQYSLFPQGQPDEDIGVSPVIASRVILGQGYYNRYRILVFRPPYLTPYPAGLDYCFFYEKKNAPGLRSKRVWRRIDHRDLAGKTKKLWRLAAEMMLAEAAKNGFVSIYDLDGVPVPIEHVTLCQQIRACNGLAPWQELLRQRLQTVNDSWLTQRFVGGADVIASRIETLHKVLSVCGFSPIEIDQFMASFNPHFGLDLLHNFYIRYLQVNQPSRFRIIGEINRCIGSDLILISKSGDATQRIFELIPPALLNDIISADGSHRWSSRNYDQMTEGDIVWDLAHGWPVPAEILMRYPHLAMQFGASTN